MRLETALSQSSRRSFDVPWRAREREGAGLRVRAGGERKNKPRSPQSVRAEPALSRLWRAEHGIAALGTKRRAGIWVQRFISCLTSLVLEETALPTPTPGTLASQKTLSPALWAFPGVDLTFS